MIPAGIPETRFARTADGVHVAYQVFGEGPIDLIVAPGVLSHLEAYWEYPGYEQFMRGVAQFARVITFDKRGNGMSDRVDKAPTLDERMEDVRTLMDVAGSRRAAMFGISEGASLCMLFAATHPDQVSHLMLYGAVPRAMAAPDYPYGFDPETLGTLLDTTVNSWGTGVMAPVLFGPRCEDPQVRKHCARMERMSSSPGSYELQSRMNALIDLRGVIPHIRTPTLVCRAEHEPMPPATYDDLVRRLPDARLVDLPGYSHYFHLDDVTSLLYAVHEFVTGDTVAPFAADRVLKTVLFSDVVDSTRTAASLGDSRWRAVLDRHDTAVRRMLERHRGTEVKTTGDGFLAVFDGPGRAVQCAQAIIEAARGVGLEARVGVHAGECEVRGDDYAGIAVHIGARVAALAGTGEVLCTSTVRDLVAGSGIEFLERGRHELKGVPGEWSLLAVT
jgi:class 3 adenylate cyclase